MPTCPYCKTYFRTLPDESEMHACPNCGKIPLITKSYATYLHQFIDYLEDSFNAEATDPNPSFNFSDGLDIPAEKLFDDLRHLIGGVK